MGLGAAIGAVAGVAGSVISGSSAKSAANTQAAAANHAADLQMQEFQQIQGEEAPFIQSGNAALQALMGGLGFTQSPGTAGTTGTGPPDAQAQLDWLKKNITASAGYTGHVGHQVEAYLAGNPNVPPDQQVAAINKIMSQSPDASATTAFQTWIKGNQSGNLAGPGGWQYGGPGALDKPFAPTDLQNTPGYQFTLNQGLDAINNTASARGGVGGGNQLKAITDYAEGLASTTYQQQLQDYMAQQNQQLGALQNVAGSGQNAVSGLAAAGQNAATNAGNALIGAGNATSAGQIAQGNALTGALGQIGGLFGGGGTNTLQALFGGGNL